MKKLVYILIIFFSLTNLVNANWYGKHAVSAPNPGNTTLTHGTSSQGWTDPTGPNKGTKCNSDGDTTGGSPNFSNGARDYAIALNNNSSSTDYRIHSDSELEISSTTIYCLYWDGSIPTLGSLSYYDGWTNQTSQTVNFSANDAGGSKLKKIELQMSYATNTPDFTNWSSWSTVKTIDNINANSKSSSYSYTGQNGYAYKFQLIITDGARNSKTATSSKVTKIDTTIPSAGDITFLNPNDGTNLLATNNQNFQAKVDINKGSPIVKVEGYFEDYNKCDDSYLTTKDTTKSDTLSINHSIEKANHNCNWDSTIGGRKYNFKITYIKDKAGNVKSVNSGIKKATYNVYSNHNSITTQTVNTTDKNNLEDTNNIADGTSYPVKINLKDTYLNGIVPSPGINRTIDFNFNVTNTTYLNQYEKSGDAIYVALPTKNTNSDYTNKLTNNNSFNNQNSDNYSSGTYNFKFKIYTPTANQYSKAIGNFTINSIDFDINSNKGNLSSQAISNSNISFKFNPLYYTNITGEQKDYGFIEGTVQTGTIKIHKNGPKSTSFNNLYLEFGKANRTASTKVKMYTISPTQEVLQGHHTNMTDLNSHTNIFSNDAELHTKIKQIPGQTLANLQNYYLSTHIRYKIDGKFVDYNSDILNKNNYFDNSTITNNTTQNGLKVLGITYTKNQKNLINNQDIKDIHVLGNLTKSKLKSQIRKNIYKAILNVSSNHAQGGSSNDINDLSGNDWNTDNKGKIIFNKKVLYFDLSNSSEKTITMGTGTLKGRKTIIIKGGDLYIKGNIYLYSKSDILGIAVLKDKNGKGGNIYIAPNVTYIAAQIYTDGAIFSAGGPTADSYGEYISSYILGIDANQKTLANQLFIKGQIFSENTIGGSRKNQPICPYYDKTNCTLEKAQKYDLNYLRRYFTYTKNDGTKAIANSGKYYYNGNIKSNYDSTYKYINYPIVIEYNPMIQITPPPLFDN